MYMIKTADLTDKVKVLPFLIYSPSSNLNSDWCLNLVVKMFWLQPSG